MKRTALFTLACLLLWSSTRAAFEDFVVGPEVKQFDSRNEVSLGCPTDEEQEMISFHDVQHDGIVDTQLLMQALMQHAQRLGMTLEELAAQAPIIEAEEDLYDEDGCSAVQEASQRQQPSWYDVFFN